MSVNPIGPSGGARKPVNQGIQSFGFPNTPAGKLAKSIEEEITRNGVDKAFSIFKGIINNRVPGFAEKVLESAPIFAAFVAKMAVDAIMKKFELEDEERAAGLQRLAQERADRARRVLPTEPL